MTGGIKHIPALADVEDIGRLDVVYRSTLGQVYVENFGDTGTNIVLWATQRGSMHRDGNHGVSLFPPGTPLVTKKTSGYNRVSFSWTNTSPAQCFRIYRAGQASGRFQHIATVTSATTVYTDFGLKPGAQYFYEVGTVYSSQQHLGLRLGRRRLRREPPRRAVSSGGAAAECAKRAVECASFVGGSVRRQHLAKPIVGRLVPG